MNIEEDDFNLFPEFEADIGVVDPNADLEVEQIDLNESGAFSLDADSSDDDDEDQEGEGKANNGKKVQLKKAADPNYEHLQIHLRTIMPLNEKAGKYACCCEAMCLNVTGTDKKIPNKGSKVENWGIGIGLYYNFLLSLIRFIFVMIIFSVSAMVVMYFTFDSTATTAEKDSASATSGIVKYL